MGRPDALYRAEVHVLHFLDFHPPEEPHEFRRFGGGGFELFFSDEGLEAPPELRLQLAGRRKKRISVYEGLSWVIEDEIP